jgi:5-methylcytosine-specific restriction protein B
LAHDFGPPWGSTLQLPENLHVLGTMNSADRSIAILDIAVRRRFAFQSLWPESEVLATMNASEKMRHAFEKLFTIFLEEAGEDAFSLMPGHAYFLDAGKDPETLIRTGLVPLLQEYLLQGYVAGFADSVRAYLDALIVPVN